ncbi:type II secretion system F family protein [Haloparvum sp. PAK95]|uniref:type II secretion system F family protein n=1 Tax=Haloparvum sp. PAK95 TaxID=3418962 RepID=UPI003D2F1F28
MSTTPGESGGGEKADPTAGRAGGAEGDTDELGRALTFLDTNFERETVVRGGYAVGIGVATLAGSLTSVLTSPSAGLLGSLLAFLAVTHLSHQFPIWLADVRRTRALGTAPDLLGRAVLRMRIEPSPERAVRFAARTGSNPLAESLQKHVRRSAGDPGPGLRPFVAEWREWFPAVERAATRLRSAAAAPPERRDRALDRALTTVVDAATDRMGAFVGDVRGPVSAIYAFGVLLPLALVALLPAARAAGAPIGAGVMTLIYVVLLPFGLLAASAWLLQRRPVAFPPPRIDGSHPDVPNRRTEATLAGLVTAGILWLLARHLVVPWAAPLAAAGGGTGVALLVVTRPRRRVLHRIRAVESGLSDALTIVGGEVAEGVAVEQAVARAGEAVSGPTGELFRAAARRSQLLRVGVGDAFRGEAGPTTSTSSPRIRGAVELLAVAGREGEPAGDVIVELADQLDRLTALDREATRQLATVTSTLANTATVFGPLVGGATVALAAGMDPGTGSAGLGAAANAASSTATTSADPTGLPATTGAAPIPVATIGRIVGVYVLLLAAILVALSTTLERGFDRTLVGYRVGLALPTATATYLVAFVAASHLL